MPITFFDYAEAIEYVKQKNLEGYVAEICGGKTKAGQRSSKYIVRILGKKQPKPVSQRFSPIRKIKDIKLTNTQLLNQFKKDDIKPLRTKEYIENLALSTLKEEGIRTVDVRVARIQNDDGYTDAELRTVKIKGKSIPFEIVIHPIHQYSYGKVLKRSIQHEVEHVKERFEENK